MARSRSTVVEELVEEMVRRINDYHYSAGESISELGLSEEFGISRTPAREAVIKLLDLGLLERSGTKIIVKTLNAGDILELFQVREAIETAAVKTILKQGRFTESYDNSLKECNEALKKSIESNDFQKNFIQDSLFHETIIACSGNQRLMEIYKKNHIQSARLRWISIITPEFYHKSIQDHEEILECLREGKLDFALEQISCHISHSVENYQNILSEGKWSPFMREFKNMNQENETNLNQRRNFHE